MTPKRLYGPTVLAGLAIGGLAYFAAGRVWGTALVLADGLPSDKVSVTGSEAVPVLSALALVVVAGSIAVLAASLRIRKVVGLIICAAGLIGAVLAFGHGKQLADAFEAAVEKSPAFTGDNFPDAYATSAWPLVTALTFVLATLLGVVVVAFGSHWPTMGRKYEAPVAKAENDEIEDDSDLWKALDQGDDPTQ